MDEEGLSWPLLGVANDEGLFQYIQGTARTPQNAADANIAPLSCQVLNHFYVTIYQCHCSQTYDIQRLIDGTQPLEAQHVMLTTVWDDTLTQAETRHGHFVLFFKERLVSVWEAMFVEEGSFQNPTFNRICLHCLPETSSWRLSIYSFAR